MSKYSKYTSFFLLFFLIIHALIAQSVNPKLKEKFDKKIAYKREVYNKTLKYIEENPNSYGLANLYYNVAEMSTEIDVQNPGVTANFYKKVLELEPNFPNKDVALYNIGYYSFTAEIYRRDEGRQNNIDLIMNWPDSLRLSEDNLKDAIGAFTEIYKEIPYSKYYSESIYRLGTIYFEIAGDVRSDKQQYYQKAIEYFDAVSKKEGDPLQHYGLFQRGWTYFTSAQFEKALVDFSSILEIIHSDSLKTKKAFFEADAVENIAYSLIEYDGTDFEQASVAADKAKEIFTSFIDEDYSKEIIRKAIELKLTYNAPMQAIDLYKSCISLYPLSIECPSYMDSVMSLYKRYPSRTRNEADAKNMIEEQMITIINNYNVDSKWYQANLENDIASQLPVIKEAFEYLEPKYFNKFLSSESEEDYLTYNTLVEDYFKFDEFQDDTSFEKKKEMRKRVVDLSLNLAENTQNPTHYFTSIEKMRNFNSLNPEHPDFYNFEGDIFYCNEQIYKLLKPVVEQSAFVDTLIGVNIDNAGLDSLFVESTYSYEDILNDPNFVKDNKEQDLIKLTYKRAEIQYERNKYDEAYADYHDLLTYEVEDDIKKLANARLAEISQSKGEYSLAEEYYRNASQYASTEEKNDYNNNILASMQSGANNLLDSGNYINAAENFLRLSEELSSEDAEKSIGFILKAIDAYKEAGDNQKAIDLLLDIASNKTEKSEVLTAYASAWAISDSIGDWHQSEDLRNQFVERYNSSNEAFNIRLQIIEFYKGAQFNEPEKAAEMYLQLHNDADNINIGDITKESIYLNAIAVYQGLKDETKEVELMLAFEKLYPDHPQSNEFLQKVALIYNENGQEEEFDKLARYLYRKDPSIDLVTGIAVQKLRNIKTEIDSLFVSEKYDEMSSRIIEFKHIDKSYQDDNLSLPLESIYEQFEYYENFIAYHKKFLAKIDELENDFLRRDPNSLIKVNTLTKWKVNMYGGDDRIKNLLITGHDIKKEIITLVQEGNAFDLQTDDRTHILYLAGKVYDFSSDVVEIQVKKFIDISNQLNDEKMKQNPDMQNQYKTSLMQAGKKLALDFRKEAATIYHSLLKTFSDDKGYSDEWTELSLQRLYDWGYRSEKIYDHIYSDSTWLINIFEIEDLTHSQEIDSLWSFVSIDSGENVLFEQAKIIEIDSETNSYVSVNFETTYEPELLKIDYAANKPFDIYLNDELLQVEQNISDTLQIDDKWLTNFSVNIDNNLVFGPNDLVFKVENDTLNNETIYLAAHLTIQYDKQQTSGQSNKTIDKNSMENEVTNEDEKINSVENEE